LHVEDDVYFQETFKTMFEAFGHIVITAGNVSQAIKELSGGSFDLAVCDDTLEDREDGLRWSEQIKLEGRNVLVLSDDPKSSTITVLHKYDAQFKDGFLQTKIGIALNSS
jgi:CheY-like chemotaxis protein